MEEVPALPVLREELGGVCPVKQRPRRRASAAPYKLVEMIGFEPIHPKELVYSQPQLSNSTASPKVPEYLRVRRGPGSMRRYSVTTIRKFLDESGTEQLEREKGIEPSCDLRLPAWKAGALPMDHSRLECFSSPITSGDLVLATVVLGL